MHSYKDPYSGKRKSLSHYNKRRERERIKKLMVHSRWYPAPAYWSDGHYDWNEAKFYPSDKAYIKRYWRKQTSKEHKKISHRKARRNEVHNSTYHKVYDYWWEIY